MVDFVIDIDGTLADARHRLHWIKDMAFWDTSKSPPRPNWTEFLKSERVSEDRANVPVWLMVKAFWSQYNGNHNRGIFITGRRESEREATLSWLLREGTYFNLTHSIRSAPIYMRSNGDRRASDIVKGELLEKARAEGYAPVLAFEDRIADAAMWRAKGLTCFHVAEGDY